MQKQIREEVYYFEDFEETENSSLVTPEFVTYNTEPLHYFAGNQMLGPFGFGGVLIRINDIPEYDRIVISFDLYIHDAWEGPGSSRESSDIWIFDLNGGNQIYTTFINTKCVTRNCGTFQHYPYNFAQAALNPENAEVINPELPGLCLYSNEIGGTKLYHIRKKYSQIGQNISLGLFADLKNLGEDNCNKSWSIDNLKITRWELADL
jgi:hypothetical protein